MATCAFAQLRWQAYAPAPGMQHQILPKLPLGSELSLFIFNKRPRRLRIGIFLDRFWLSSCAFYVFPIPAAPFPSRAMLGPRHDDGANTKLTQGRPSDAKEGVKIHTCDACKPPRVEHPTPPTDQRMLAGCCRLSQSRQIYGMLSALARFSCYRFFRHLESR